jgi:8-oxo-dGTP pyrophosphatase MutT (NUDIX family)
MDPEFRQKLVSALSLEFPYPERVRLNGGRAAAVLILIGREREGRSFHGLSTLITRRTELVGTHKGQMAFPGGVSEPEELSGANGLVWTALRETDEEVGISPDLVEVLGQLPPLTTITGFEVTPVVGFLRKPIEQIELKLNEHEIAEALWVPLATLMEPTTYSTELKRVGQMDYPIHVYQVSGYRIWGATGSMIKNLLDRMQSLS